MIEVDFLAEGNETAKVLGEVLGLGKMGNRGDQ